MRGAACRPAAYPILEVRGDWQPAPEPMGSKRKFWFRSDAAGGRDRLFKYPRPGTGEHWAEKIAAEVAAALGIRHARVELAEFQGCRGSATESFARRGRELHHGNDLLEGVVYGYDAQKRFGQSSHTLGNIWTAMDYALVHPGAARRAKTIIADYLVLDAIIGNTDRHHENWGLLRRRTARGWHAMVAPSFDHASSMGRELQNTRRERLLAGRRVGSYVERGRGAIYWEEDGPPISPLELVRRSVDNHGGYFSSALARLRRLDAATIGAIVNRIPDDWMSAPARTFAVALLCYNLNELQDLAP